MMIEDLNRIRIMFASFIPGAVVRGLALGVGARVRNLGLCIGFSKEPGCHCLSDSEPGFFNQIPTLYPNTKVTKESDSKFFRLSRSQIALFCHAEVHEKKSKPLALLQLNMEVERGRLEDHHAPYGARQNLPCYSGGGWVYGRPEEQPRQRWRSSIS